MTSNVHPTFQPILAGIAPKAETPQLKAGASYVVTDDGILKVVAQTYSGCDTDRYEARDYARLFAAAPELLAVLRQLFCEGPVEVAFAGNPTACDALEARARAAIAKAEGR